MNTEYQMTSEERAFDHLFHEQWEVLSEAARVVLREARLAAYTENMVHNVLFDKEEYDEAMEKMRLAAARLTDHECEQLTKVWRAALSAAASVDPDDYETPVKYRAYCGDLHWYYRMLSGMVEDVLQEKKNADLEKAATLKKETAEQGPEDYSDIPF